MSFALRAGSQASGTDPRSRILRDPALLEDWELLSILLRTGSHKTDVYKLSQEILIHVGGLANFASFCQSTLPNIPGLGLAKKTTLLAISELASRIRRSDLLQTISPFPLCDLYNSLWLLTARETRECFYIITFSLEGLVRRVEKVATGTLTEVSIHKRDLAKVALDDSSGYCLIAHNHPQQTCLASIADFNLFAELRRFFAELEISCFDQWVLGIDGLYSCRHSQVLDCKNWSRDFLPEEYSFLTDNLS
ncbi:JAB domain-containing protein [Leptospira sp. GIMC2001]|uniref:JAB domain-containing protein n=1 Tax=Leptospira sp. GIMC2001 TaxID=1513297 RepID=UPI002349B3EE|nr:JAB domain-containing protein [Leptospira sp. GIMC2001]WCL50275.1 DNA repair protein [Leptospira sp. GIMC2001]